MLIEGGITWKAGLSEANLTYTAETQEFPPEQTALGLIAVYHLQGTTEVKGY